MGEACRIYALEGEGSKPRDGGAIYSDLGSVRIMDQTSQGTLSAHRVAMEAISECLVKSGYSRAGTLAPGLEFDKVRAPPARLLDLLCLVLGFCQREEANIHGVCRGYR